MSFYILLGITKLFAQVGTRFLILIFLKEVSSVCLICGGV